MIKATEFERVPNVIVREKNLFPFLYLIMRNEVFDEKTGKLYFDHYVHKIGMN